jgi:4-hydroxymandelate oxidase
MPKSSEPEFETLEELEHAALAHIDPTVRSYVQGGSGDERSLKWNVGAFRRWSLIPRALVDVSVVDLSTTLLGRNVRVPFFVAPMAYQQQLHAEGEVGVARAADEAGALATFSTLSSCSMEKIAEVGGSAPRWFQLYLQSDFATSRELVERAERAGYSALILTIDAPVLGVRDRQAAGGFAIDAGLRVGNGENVTPPARSPQNQGSVWRLPAESRTTWAILAELRSITRLPIVVKGVLSPHDARAALDHGARGILVSNHGGRQLNGAPASLDALPGVLEEVGTAAEVYLDGGARRAADVLIALALGARGVGIGRPFLWALALGGEKSVARYIRLVATELAVSLALCGRRTVAEIDRTLVERRPEGGFLAR